MLETSRESTAFWKNSMDGVKTALTRANLSTRSIELPSDMSIAHQTLLLKSINSKQQDKLRPDEAQMFMQRRNDR